MGCFAKVKVGKRYVVEYYSGTLFWPNLFGREQDDRIFSEGALSVSVNDFQTYSMHIPEGVKEYEGNLHSAWIVSAAFNPLQCINDLRY